MRTSEKTGEIAAALAKAQGEIKSAIKDSTNPHFKSRYADLASVVDACRTPLAKNNIAFSHGLDSSDGQTVLVTCRLFHMSGEWMECGLTLRPTKPDPQGIGSAATYGRRYTLASMVGVATDDDDGNAASASPTQASRPVAERPIESANASGTPTKRDIQIALREWLGIQNEDMPPIVRKLWTRAGCTGMSTDEEITSVYNEIRSLRANGVTLDTLDAALAPKESA